MDIGFVNANSIRGSVQRPPDPKKLHVGAIGVIVAFLVTDLIIVSHNNMIHSLLRYLTPQPNNSIEAIYGNMRNGNV